MKTILLYCGFLIFTVLLYSCGTKNDPAPAIPITPVVVTPPVVDKPITKVIGATGMAADLIKNTDGTYSIKDIIFSSLATGTQVKLSEGTGAKIEYRNNNGTLSVDFSQSAVFMVQSNPFINDAGTVADADTATVTGTMPDGKTNIGIGYYVVSGIDVSKWGINRLLIVPVKASVVAHGAETIINSGISQSDVPSVTSDQLMGIATPKTIALTSFK